MTAKIVDAFVTNYMQHSEPIVAKASDVEEQSDGIVVSFGSEWYQPLCQRKFRAVIRKRIPKTLKPAWLYFHVNAPVSAICARAQIRAVRELKLDEAKKRAVDLALSTDEVNAYVAGDPTVGCYELGDIAIAKKEVTIAELTEHMVYHPPQSFFVLSHAGKELLDKLAGFQIGQRERGGKR